jgi:pimeloyl-ACP methyl ester carboxylesterase
MPKISYQEYGSGKPVILLHGFPFTKEIWKEFAPELAKEYKVYALDLPGFGASAKPESYLLHDIARELTAWIEERSIKDCVLIGHSLGGYIALALADMRTDLFSGLVLFHSTAKADNEEKKQSRDKVIEFVDRNGVEAFTSNSVLPLFADKTHPAIELVKKISATSDKDALKGYTRAMRDRKETFDVLEDFPNPVLFIVGKEDPGIPVESIIEQSKLCLKAEVQIFDRVAHMGMFEAKNETLSVIRGFLQRTFSI